MPEATVNPTLQTDPELTEQEITNLTTAASLEGASAADIAEKNKRLYARLQKEKAERAKFEEENKQVKEKLAALEKPPTPVLPSAPPVDELPIREVLGLQAEGFSEKEILDLAEEAKSLGVPIKKILSNPTFKSGLEVKRTKARAEQNTPSPSFGGLTAKGKNWEDRNLTDSERREMFNELTRGGIKQPL